MRRGIIAIALLLFGGLVSPAAEKDERWLEVRSPHFAVISNADEKLARRAAAQFEQFRDVFRAAMPGLRVDSGTPLVILAVKDEKSLKAVLPELWLRKGGIRPAGFFLRGLGKDYVALRLDAVGENPFHVIYHEYTHDLMNLNYGIVPQWLSEGLAEFFAHALINSRQATVGLPARAQLALLRKSQLLPLDTLFAVNFTSPYYTEEDKTTIFYAQSWALAHYLMLAENGERRPEIADYLKMLEQDTPAPQAAARAFGNLPALASRLNEYIRQNTFSTLGVPAPAAADDSSYSVREIPLAESMAIRADFLLHNERYD
ncbi:MAG TPA: DUF1570 domain-containing protein, partial [Candidatus Acidoferrales bacterium]|nr:DUF1570 domain-containing protein [Candidatus Acidoferrales bacterium]